MTGTTPPGTSNPWQAARWVQQMFGAVAPKYDLLNHLLSFNVDRNWRKRLKLHLRPVLERQDACVVDLCCGTGDVLLALRAEASAQIFGADFCHPMLTAAQAKGVHRLIECDALELPLADNSADALTIAFGFRNLADYEAGLREFRRLLKPGGMLAILEFSHPRGRLLRSAFGFYSNLLLPAIGAAVSGSSEAYRYLPESVRKFPRAEKLAEMMAVAGFESVSFELLTGGIAALHVGSKRPVGEDAGRGF
ncbi:MAG TPA: bifunctional demethylmenaquinone methyltransferase/2-methoxy-6-polyprenyl-1,4-benzoquinol methylase UbiE [Bryobacteraceae bacterium]